MKAQGPNLPCATQIFFIFGDTQVLYSALYSTLCSNTVQQHCTAVWALEIYTHTTLKTIASTEGLAKAAGRGEEWQEQLQCAVQCVVQCCCPVCYAIVRGAAALCSAELCTGWRYSVVVQYGCTVWLYRRCCTLLL